MNLLFTLYNVDQILFYIMENSLVFPQRENSVFFSFLKMSLVFFFEWKN